LTKNFEKWVVVDHNTIVLVIMRIQVDNLSCVRQPRYRSMVFAVDTELVEERAQELGASSWDLRMALAVELRARSINIDKVYVTKVKCRGQRLDCFYVINRPEGQYTDATITSALEALGLTAVQCGKLADSETEAQLKRGMVLLDPWVRPTDVAAAGEIVVDAGDSDNGSESGDDSDNGNDSSDDDAAGVMDVDTDHSGSDSDAGAATATCAGADEAAKLTAECLHAAVTALRCDAIATAVVAALHQRNQYIADVACDALLDAVRPLKSADAFEAKVNRHKVPTAQLASVLEPFVCASACSTGICAYISADQKEISCACCWHTTVTATGKQSTRTAGAARQLYCTARC
jgi:hypothetical protein